MKKTKRFLALLCAMTMMLCVVSSMSVAASAISTQIKVASQIVEMGQSTTRVSVPIEISGNTGIAGLLMGVSYDEALTLVSVDEGTAFSDMEITVSGNMNSPVKILWDGAEDDTSNGVIATLNFDVPTAAAGSYDIEISANDYDICDADQNNVAATLVDGTITVEDPDAPKIVVSEVNGNAGKTVDVKIDIENNTGIIAMMLSVDYDDSLTLTKVTDGTILPKVEHSETLDTKPYVMSWGDDEAEANITANGTVATLTFEVADSAVAGSVLPISITYSPEDIYDVNTNEVAFNVQNGFVNVISYKVGDVNTDGSINAKDRTILARSLVGWTNLQIDNYTADVDANGTLNAKDSTILARHIVGWPEYAVLPYK